MKKRIKSYFSKAFETFKLRPIAFTGAVLTMCFGFVNILLSTFTLSFYIGLTGVCSAILGITKFHALWQYKNIQTFDNKKAIKEVEYIVARRMAIATAILSFLHFSITIVITFFHEEPMRNYELFLILYFGGFAIGNVIAATVNAIITRKNNNIIIHHLKLISLANAFIVLSVTERTLLFYAEFAQAKIVSAIGGIFFSIAAGVVCLFMFKKSNRVKRFIVRDSINQHF